MTAYGVASLLSAGEKFSHARAFNAPACHADRRRLRSGRAIPYREKTFLSPLVKKLAS